MAEDHSSATGTYSGTPLTLMVLLHFRQRFWVPALVLLTLLGLGSALWLTFRDKESDTKPAGEFYQDFRGSRHPVPPLNLHGLDVNDVTRAEERGFRITLPTNRQVGVSPSFRLTGDFEVTGTYDLLSTDQPSAGYGVSVALELATDWVTTNNKKYARVARLLRPNRGGGSVYLADHWITDSALPKKTEDSHSVPTATRTGQLRLLRKGSILRFLAADADGNDFGELNRTEFGDDDLVVQFVVNNNGSPTKVDALLVEFKIRAMELTAIGPLPTAEEDRDGPPLQGGGWETWLAFGVLMTVALGLGLALRQRRRPGITDTGAAASDEPVSAGRAAPVPMEENPTNAEATSASTSFSCSGCGKRLKAKAELAGRNVKCPQCGNVVLIR